jgi:hypothetical protein
MKYFKVKVIYKRGLLGFKNSEKESDYKYYESEEKMDDEKVKKLFLDKRFIGDSDHGDIDAVDTIDVSDEEYINSSGSEKLK